VNVGAPKARKNRLVPVAYDPSEVGVQIGFYFRLNQWKGVALY
jgi:hypothetical protein